MCPTISKSAYQRRNMWMTNDGFRDFLVPNSAQSAVLRCDKPRCFHATSYTVMQHEGTKVLELHPTLFCYTLRHIHTPPPSKCLLIPPTLTQSDSCQYYSPLGHVVSQFVSSDGCGMMLSARIGWETCWQRVMLRLIFTVDMLESSQKDIRPNQKIWDTLRYQNCLTWKICFASGQKHAIFDSISGSTKNLHSESLLKSNQPKGSKPWSSRWPCLLGSRRVEWLCQTKPTISSRLLVVLTSYLQKLST